MPRYIITQEAIDDINNIWLYTAENWSIEQADRYYNLIMDEIEYIADNVQTARDIGTVRKDYRYSKIKSHLIFFKENKGESIEVVRVLHERMDIENRLTD